MFFVLSKVFWAATQPLGLVIVFVVLAAILALGRRVRLAASAAAIAGIVLFICCYTNIGSLMLEPLESRFARPKDSQDVTGIILLGGGNDDRVSQARQDYELNGAGDRFVESLRLALIHPKAQIVISGGASSLISDEEGDAAAGQRFFAAFHIDPSRILLDPKSRNTAENAENTKRLVGNEHGGKWLLVTSAYHMPRAVGTFRKVGLPIIPWPVDYRTTGRKGLRLDLGQPVDNLGLVTLAAKEWIGLLAYWETGRTSALFPAPR